MKNLLKNTGKIFCIGIGGSGVSCLASILHKTGKKVAGSDEAESEITDRLQSEGIKIHIGHKSENLSSDVGLVIYSPAIPEDNPELIKAKELKIKTISYPGAVGELTKEKNTIAVCGTHGKTTTTMLISSVFLNAGKNQNNKYKPTVIVGSHSNILDGKNYAVSDGNYLILEACEHQESFLNYYPDTIVVTTMEPDHLDYFKNAENYYAAYEKFLDKLSKNGKIIANYDDKNIRKLLAKHIKKNKGQTIITFGSKKGSDYRITKTNRVYYNKEYIAELHLGLKGSHNRMNALAAFIAAKEAKIKTAVINQGLSDLQTIGRRRQVLSMEPLVIDDYAHHPTEIKATLKAERELFPDFKIICIFQPHQYSRTWYLKNKFAVSFKNADKIIISDIYKTRDTIKSESKISARKLAGLIKHYNINVLYGGNLDKTLLIAKKELEQCKIKADKCIFITMGAGDIWKVGSKLAEN